MAKIVKLSKDNVQIYPQTITDAIADVDSKMVLSKLLKRIDTRLSLLETTIGTSGSTSENIDNLMELLSFFNGVKDDTTFKAIIEKFIEGQEIDMDGELDNGEYPDFDDMLKN